MASTLDLNCPFRSIDNVRQLKCYICINDMDCHFFVVVPHIKLYIITYQLQAKENKCGNIDHGTTYVQNELQIIGRLCMELDSSIEMVSCSWSPPSIASLKVNEDGVERRPGMKGIGDGLYNI